LWERAEPSAGRQTFRHSFYARIAKCEPEVWALCGTGEQRAKAIKQPNGKDVPPPAPVIVRAWNAALAAAFGGLQFKHTVGSKSKHEPNGHGTDELKTIS
jgi:hypothetical protein